jgi:antitoxin component of MazEF toxin-antitoxin module
MEKNVAEILDAARRVVASMDLDRHARHERVVEFEDAILKFPETNDPELSLELAPMLEQLNDNYERYETELESCFARKVASESADPKTYPLYHRFVTLITNEVKMLKLNQGCSLAMIGSGPFPITAILLFTLFGIEVVAIDGNPEAVAISRQVIKTLNLESGISVEVGDGRSFVAEDASAVIVALLAHPKDLILKNIFDNYSNCSSVICRTSHGLRQALYRPTDPSSLARYSTIAIQRAFADQTISSISLARCITG